MRSPSLVLLCLALMLPTGCSSTSSVDALQLPTPSHEKTGSIRRPAAPILPPASVGAGPDPEMAVADAPKKPEPLQAIDEVAPPRPQPRPGRAERGTIYAYGFGDADPVNFGRHSPRKLDVHGVDVSRWQGDIDWAKLRRHGANFVYIKATDGGDHLDPMFMKNWQGADEAGLKRGAYHFFYWCRVASEQADWFIRNVPKVDGALPPVIDVEWNHQSSCKRRPSRDVVLEKMKVFMDRLERHYGQRPVIYTTPDFYEDNLRGAFRDHAFWLRSTAEHPSKVYPDRKWLFWQYSGSGLSQGVEGQIDLNVFNGDENDWWAWLGGRRLVADAD
ncbi:MAG: glycoside hydrolase family 25 protein [Rhizobiaceae bacterium]|jgi:lysozyme